MPDTRTTGTIPFAGTIPVAGDEPAPATTPAAAATPAAEQDPAASAVGLAFAVFNEVGILAQLSSTLLEAHLPPGFVAAQFAVLNHLWRRPEGATPQRMARAFQVPKTSMTHSIAVLERAGLVAVLPNPDDGRSKIVRITDAGIAFRDRTIAALAPDTARALARLTPGTLDALLPPLRHLRAVMDAARDAAKG
ncbi:MAG: MarR family winged helix-turn-helix transcriptional regulator [Gemmobacter sp.]